MNCAEYRRYWLGEVTAEAFAAHRTGCAECRRAVALDAIVQAQVRGLPVPAAAPGSWERIAADLDAQPAVRAAGRARAGVPPVWRLAAVLVVAVGLAGALLLRPSDPGPRNLLTEKALARVESLEAQYEEAIRDLEAIAEPLIAGAGARTETVAGIDTELLLHYRSRLETVDAQIRRCKAVLARDGANAHVRRYLLAAYQDKRETLSELLALARS
jgi:hypothetical protein